jgi:hypothetical protein
MPGMWLNTPVDVDIDSTNVYGYVGKYGYGMDNKES